MIRFTHVIAAFFVFATGTAVPQDAGDAAGQSPTENLYAKAVDDIDLTVPPSSRRKCMEHLDAAKNDPLSLTSSQLKSCYTFMPVSAQVFVAAKLQDGLDESIKSGKDDQVSTELRPYLKIVRLLPELSTSDFWMLSKHGRSDVRRLEEFALASEKHDRWTPFSTIQTVLEYPSLRERLEKHREVMKEPGYDDRVRANIAAKEKASEEHRRLARMENLNPRTWTSKSGEHTTKGEFHSFIDGVVTITKPDLSQIEVRLRHLSAKDQQFIRDKIKNGQAVPKE